MAAALAVKTNSFEVEEMQSLSQQQRDEISILIKSGMFGESKDVYKALAKIKIGQSMGLDAQQSMRGIILQSNGMPSFTANLIAYLIKASKRYDYTVKELKDEKQVVTGIQVIVEKLRDGQWLFAGESSFTLEDAKIAKLAEKDTYKKFPKNMYFSRALSNAGKWFCPDVFGGFTPYTPDEIPGNTVEIDPETLEAIPAANPDTTKPQSVGKQTIALLKEAMQLLKDTDTTEYTIFGHFGVTGWDELTEGQLNQMIDLLETKKKAKGL